MIKGKIVYKVVEKRTRHGSNWTLYKNKMESENGLQYLKQINKLRRDHIKYFPRYLKGTEVRMALGSIGILTYETIYDANIFKDQYFGLRNTIIIKVEGFGRLYPQVIIPFCGDKPEFLFSQSETYSGCRCIKDSFRIAAFKYVKVLE